MTHTIRMLRPEDFPFYEQMDTGLEEDYMLQAFHRITSRNHQLYGLFIDNELAVTGGFSVYAGKYAMLGRLRSAIPHRGKGLATELMLYVAKKVFELDHIKWAGALTETSNKPAQRILEKMKMTHYATWHSAVSTDISPLTEGRQRWHIVESLEEKRAWLEKAYINNQELFPYECYYPLPASEALYPDEILRVWNFFENEDQTRFLIAKYDVKQTRYCHIVYPWEDLNEQPGFWETVRYAQKQLEEQRKEKLTIWMDLTEREVQTLPSSHPFQLPSEWMVYGRFND